MASREGNPFIGSRPFERADSDVFFGREPELCELISQVIANRVVVLHSPPGAGKTSLVNAGLIPRLQIEEHFDVLPAGTVRPRASGDVTTPSLRNVFVSNLLSSWVHGDGPSAETERSSPAEGTIAGYLRARLFPRTPDGLTAARLFVVDQLEDLFTLHPERWRDRAGFFEQIAEALDDDECLRVVLVIRDEYVAALDPYRTVLPGGLRTRFRLERLTRDAAVAAIVRPFEHTGKAVPPQLAAGMAHELLRFPVAVREGDSLEVEGEFIDPLQLQLACQILWSELPLGA